MYNKETIKEFLKPNWKKIIIAIIFIITSLLFVYDHILPLLKSESDCMTEVTIVDFYTIARGFPLPYLLIDIGGGIAQGFSIFYLGLLVDSIFWYFFSCLVIFIWNKFRK